MQEVQIVATFDSADTASDVSRSLNAWFQWVMDGGEGEIPDFFDDFGISTEEYALERESDTDWEEQPIAKARSNHVIIHAYTSETQDLLQELLESMGAFEVEITAEGDS